MARSDRGPLAAARALLRERHEAQQSALNEYMACHAKVTRLEATLAELNEEQSAALGRLAHVTDAATAAQLVGASLHAAREALATHRAQPSDRTRREDAAAAQRTTGSSDAA